MNIYLIGSLRNKEVPYFGNSLRALGHEVFDDWHGVGPHADDHWQEYETIRGRSYPEALAGDAAQNTFHFDLRHIQRADMAVMMLPAGKSGHLEFGYMIGQGKPGLIYFNEGPPERWDLMYLFATSVHFSLTSLLDGVRDFAS